MSIVGELMEVILYVQDVQAQVTFYRSKLGLAVTSPAGVTDFAHQFWVTLGTGACTLVLHGGGQRRLGADAPKIVFRVTDIEAARRELVERGVALSAARACGCATEPIRRGINSLLNHILERR